MRPKVLMADTSTAFASLAFFDGTKAHALCPDDRMRHSETLFAALDELLRGRQAALEDVDLFAVGLGPGSFTGLRVGVVSIKTLAYALGKKIVGISSLVAVAEANPEADRVVLDAKRGNVFSAAFRRSRMVDVARMQSVSEFLSTLRKGQRVTGSALEVYRKDILRIVGSGGAVGCIETWSPKAQNLLPEALRRWDSGSFDDAITLAPQYLYDKTCMVVPPKPRRISAR